MVLRLLAFFIAVLFFTPVQVALAACQLGTCSCPTGGCSKSCCDGQASYQCLSSTVLAPSSMSVSIVRNDQEQTCIFSIDAGSETLSRLARISPEITHISVIPPPTNKLIVGRPYKFSHVGNVPDGNTIEFLTEPKEGSFRFGRAADSSTTWELVPLEGFEQVVVRGTAEFPSTGTTDFFSQRYELGSTGQTVFDLILHNLTKILAAVLTVVTVVSIVQKVKINELKRRNGLFDNDSSVE